MPSNSNVYNTYIAEISDAITIDEKWTTVLQSLIDGNFFYSAVHIKLVFSWHPTFFHNPNLAIRVMCRYSVA